MLIVVLLYVAGIVLILAEFMLPGLVLGILGGVLVLASMGYALYAYPDIGWMVAIGQVLGVGVSFALGLLLIRNTRLGGMLTLAENLDEESGYTNLVSDRGLIGRTGVVLTPLRPSGTIEVGDARLDAVSAGTFIVEGARVRITEVHGNRIVVEPAEEE